MNFTGAVQVLIYCKASLVLSPEEMPDGMKRASSEAYNLCLPTLATTSSSLMKEDIALQETTDRTNNANVEIILKNLLKISIWNN